MGAQLSAIRSVEVGHCPLHLANMHLQPGVRERLVHAHALLLAPDQAAGMKSTPSGDIPSHTPAGRGRNRAWGEGAGVSW